MADETVDVVLRGPRMVSGGTEVTDGWVAIQGTTIVATGTGQVPPTDRVVEASGVIVPGFVDIHCHGGGGAAFADGPQATGTALQYHRRHGTTRTVMSLVTASVPDLAAQVAALREVCVADPLVLGLHLEGPYLSADHRGAHDESLLTTPTSRDVQTLLEAAQGYLVQITLAPELPGAEEAIGQLRRAGVRVAVGHSAVDYEQAGAAFAAGGTILTHAFNAMAPIHHRAPGPVLAAAEQPEVMCEVINDGVHVHPAVVRLLHGLAGPRVVYVTDAMAAAGGADGAYESGGLAVTVTDGVPRLDATGSIAGSTLTMDAAVRQAVQIGIGLPQAITAATSAPARAIGMADRIGLLAPGYPADVVLLDADLQVEQVWGQGQVLAGV